METFVTLMSLIGPLMPMTGDSPIAKAEMPQLFAKVELQGRLECYHKSPEARAANELITSLSVVVPNPGNHESKPQVGAYAKKKLPGLETYEIRDLRLYLYLGELPEADILQAGKAASGKTVKVEGSIIEVFDFGRLKGTGLELPRHLIRVSRITVLD
jgi:hypothetical protein